MENPIHIEFEQSVGILAIANAKKANALSKEVIDGLVEAMRNLAQKQARVAIIRAEPGSKIFSAGHDVREIPRDGTNPFAWTVPLERLLRIVRECAMPVIAMCEGSIWGARATWSFRVTW